MKFSKLDTVVLAKDLPEQGLREGDVGAIVEVYDPDGLEVEFVRLSGHTQAVVTLRVDDVRSAGDTDVMAARELDRSA